MQSFRKNCLTLSKGCTIYKVTKNALSWRIINRYLLFLDSEIDLQTMDVFVNEQLRDLKVDLERMTKGPSHESHSITSRGKHLAQIKQRAHGGNDVAPSQRFRRQRQGRFARETFSFYGLRAMKGGCNRRINKGTVSFSLLLLLRLRALIRYQTTPAMGVGIPRHHMDQN